MQTIDVIHGHRDPSMRLEQRSFPAKPAAETQLSPSHPPRQRMAGRSWEGVHKGMQWTAVIMECSPQVPLALQTLHVQLTCMRDSGGAKVCGVCMRVWA